ncbi:MAG: hypothetical protein IJE62_06565 [Clostridia bacterium]|nr:hypothetical protein [Clostridia bacterium]
MSLLMAGFCPGYFKLIGAYVPITDLKNGQSKIRIIASMFLLVAATTVMK